MTMSRAMLVMARRRRSLLPIILREDPGGRTLSNQEFATKTTSPPPPLLCLLEKESSRRRGRRGRTRRWPGSPSPSRTSVISWASLSLVRESTEESSTCLSSDNIISFNCFIISLGCYVFINFQQQFAMFLHVLFSFTPSSHVLKHVKPTENELKPNSNCEVNQWYVTNTTMVEEMK